MRSAKSVRGLTVAEEDGGVDKDADRLPQLPHDATEDASGLLTICCKNNTSQHN